LTSAAAPRNLSGRGFQIIVETHALPAARAVARLPAAAIDVSPSRTAIPIPQRCFAFRGAVLIP
jgi:hypothetical protein